eukprot:5084768-Prymnesium_polylepis.1
MAYGLASLDRIPSWRDKVGIRGSVAHKPLGFSAWEMRQAGFSARDLKDANYTPSEMRTASFKAGTLRRVGFSAKDLKCFNVKELRGACTAVELAEEEYTAAELYPIFSARELLPAYPTIEIKQAGATLRELLRAGLTVEEALDADFTVLELKVLALPASVQAALPFLIGLTLSRTRVPCSCRESVHRPWWKPALRWSGCAASASPRASSARWASQREILTQRDVLCSRTKRSSAGSLATPRRSIPFEHGEPTHLRHRLYARASTTFDWLGSLGSYLCFAGYYATSVTVARVLTADA